MEANKTLPDLSLDYHAHIAPGCDHGSDGLDTSLAQVAQAARAGVHTVCATPHFYPQKESVRSFLDRRDRALRALRERLPEGSPRVLSGAEVLICPGMERLEGLEALCRQDSRELLLELPFYSWPDSVWDTAYALLEREELHIVIAHADRYPPQDIQRLADEGALLQLNADSLTHPLRRGRYLGWLRRGCVRYLGSDIHMLSPGYRDWEKAARWLRKLT